MALSLFSVSGVDVEQESACQKANERGAGLPGGADQNLIRINTLRGPCDCRYFGRALPSVDSSSLLSLLSHYCCGIDDLTVASLLAA
jgi:hypothetical protein